MSNADAMRWAWAFLGDCRGD